MGSDGEPKDFLKELLAFYSDIDGNVNKVNKTIYVMNKMLEANNVDFTKMMARQFPLASIDEDMEAYHCKFTHLSGVKETVCQDLEHSVQLSGQDHVDERSR